MGISFAGFELALEDPDGSLREFLDEWIPFEDIKHVAQWPNAVWNGLPANTGMTQPNWASPLRPKLNTFYCPTGASRWGFGFFFTNTTTKKAIVNAGAAGTLVINDPISQVGFKFNNCFLLPPHPISAVSDEPNAGWILPIVDARFFWQFPASTVLGTLTTAPTFTTWQGLFSSVGSALTGIAGIDDPSNLTGSGLPAAYLNPYQWGFSRANFQNAAVLLDVMLASIGGRLVPRPQSIYSGLNPSTNAPFVIQNYSLAATTRDAGFALAANMGGDQGAQQVGIFGPAVGDTGATTPAFVKVAFPKFTNGLILPDSLGTRYTKSVTASAAGFGALTTNPQYTKTIRSTCPANYTTGGGTPDNQTSLDALATQIATDFYGWLTWFQDQTVVGMTGRLPTGFDDYWEYSIGRVADTGSYEARCRVHSVPHNFCCDDLFHWDTALYNWTGPDTVARSSRSWEYGNIILGTLDSNLGAFGTASISVTSADVPIPTDATQHIVVTEGTGGAPTSGTPVIALRDGMKWMVLDATTSNNTQITGTFASAVTAGNSGTFTLTLGGTVTANVRRGVCIASQVYKVVLTDAAVYEIVDPTMMIQCQYSAANALVATGTPTVTIFSGTGGSEATTGVTVTAYLRKGVLYKNKTYLLYYDDEKWEILNPTLSGIGQTNATHNKGASGTINIFSGTLGSETTTGVTLTAWNRYANVASTKWVRWAWNDDSAGFDLAAAEC